MTGAQEPEESLTRHDRWWLSKWGRSDDLAEHFTRYGTLYAADHVETMSRKIRNDIASELGFAPEERMQRLPQQQDHFSAKGRGLEQHCFGCYGECLMEFHAVRGERTERGWACERCRRHTRTVLGCLHCLFVQCKRCVANGGTLAAIGSAIGGLKRETVRQTQERALRKLQHPKNSALLKGFL